MNDPWTSVSPGGVPFKQPTQGDVDDWTPDTEYGAHPCYLDPGDGDDGGEDRGIDRLSIGGDGEPPTPDGVVGTAQVESAGRDTATEAVRETVARGAEAAAAFERPPLEPGTQDEPSLATTEADQTSLRASPALVLGVRDIAIFHFLARHRMATYDQLARAFGTTVNALRQRLPRLERADYLTQTSRGAPAYSVWMVTRDGMKLTGLKLPVAVVTSTYEHTLGLTDLAIMYATLGVTLLTETEIRAGQKASQPKASSGIPATGATTGPPGPPPFVCPRVGESRHRPDMVLYYPTGIAGRFRCVAVELERTYKGPKRLCPILRAYRDAADIDEVRYFALDERTAKGVARAAIHVGAASIVKIKKFTPSRQ